MATYAIGDIQGCFKTFKKLLKQISFDRKKDKLFLAGDIVNRGPNSLEVLRWAMDHDNCIESVLGNHDIHLLALASGITFSAKRQKSLDPILKAKDRDDLLQWLSERPLVYKEGRIVLVHAGILPDWSIEEVIKLSKKTHKEINSKRAYDFFKKWYKKDIVKWREDLVGFERHAFVLNACTRMRLCKSASEIDLGFTGVPEDAPPHLRPWFSFQSRKSTNHTILFGHWAALGVRVMSNAISLDSGCVWGGSLTALRLEDGLIFSEKSVEL